MAKVFSDGLNTVYGKQGGTGAAFILPESASAKFAIGQQQKEEANLRTDAYRKVREEEAKQANINKAISEIKPGQGWTRYNNDLVGGYQNLINDAAQLSTKGINPMMDSDWKTKQFLYQQGVAASNEWKNAFEQGLQKLNANPEKYRTTVEDFISVFPSSIEEGVNRGFTPPQLQEKFTTADILKDIKATSATDENPETGFTYRGANRGAIEEQIFGVTNTPAYKDVAIHDYGVDPKVPFLPGVENKKQAELLFKDESSAEALKSMGIEDASELWSNQEKYRKLNSDLVRKKVAEVDTARLFQQSASDRAAQNQLTPNYNVEDQVAVLQTAGKGLPTAKQEPSTSLIYFNTNNIPDRLSPAYEVDTETGKTVKNTQVGDYNLSSVELKPIIYGKEAGTEFTVASDRMVRDIIEGKKPGISEDDIVYKFIVKASKNKKDKDGKIKTTSHYFDSDYLKGSKKVDVNQIESAILEQPDYVQEKYFLGLVRKDPDLRKLTTEQQKQYARDLMNAAKQE